MKERGFYAGVVAVAVAAASILWAFLNGYVWDPGAVGFLSHKSGLERTVHVPVWLTVLDVHIAFASVALAAGAVNVSARVLRHYRKAHRVVGYVYLVSVLAVVLTSGYMAPYATGGRLVGMAFNLLNLIWPAVTITALIFVKRKQIGRHRRWMMRSYAFCFTNVSIHLIESLLSGVWGWDYETAYKAGVAATLVLLPLAAEAVIRFGARMPWNSNKGAGTNAEPEYPNRIV